MNIINNLEISLILDNIKRFGGFREKEVLKSLIKIEVIQNEEKYKIYHFEDVNGLYFEYNFKNHTITG